MCLALFVHINKSPHPVSYFSSASAMKYLSTRGGVTGLTFEDALLSGYAEDGGILLPEDIPHLSSDTIKSWSRLSYPELVYEIACRFISEDEIPRDTLKGKCEKNYRKFNTGLFHEGLFQTLKTSNLRSSPCILMILQSLHPFIY